MEHFYQLMIVRDDTDHAKYHHLFETKADEFNGDDRIVFDIYIGDRADPSGQRYARCPTAEIAIDILGRLGDVVELTRGLLPIDDEAGPTMAYTGPFIKPECGDPAKHGCIDDFVAHKDYDKVIDCLHMMWLDLSDLKQYETTGLDILTHFRWVKSQSVREDISAAAAMEQYCMTDVEITDALFQRELEQLELESCEKLLAEAETKLKTAEGKNRRRRALKSERSRSGAKLYNGSRTGRRRSGKTWAYGSRTGRISSKRPDINEQTPATTKRTDIKEQPDVASARVRGLVPVTVKFYHGCAGSAGYLYSKSLADVCRYPFQKIICCFSVSNGGSYDLEVDSHSRSRTVGPNYRVFMNRATLLAAGKLAMAAQAGFGTTDQY